MEISGKVAYNIFKAWSAYCSNGNITENTKLRTSKLNSLFHTGRGNSGKTRADLFSAGPGVQRKGISRRVCAMALSMALIYLPGISGMPALWSCPDARQRPGMYIPMGYMACRGHSGMPGRER